MPSTGMVNEAWSIGDGFVLRIIRLEECDEEASREAAVVPLLVEAGIRTPALVAADFSHEHTPRPYTIYERAPGVLMADCEPGSAFEPAYSEIGRQAAALHAMAVTEDLRPKLRERETLEAGETIAKARDAGVIDAQEADEIERWFAEVLLASGEPGGECIVHADIHPWNATVLPESGELGSILDWGDTSLGEPAIEFASMPLFATAAMLSGYREAGGSVDAGLVGRALLYGLRLGLWEMRMLDTKNFDRGWWRMPVGGWQEYRRTAEMILDQG
jgi:aminoglycoside phosphotransferase (APT) family kinase protein